jgi:hypothetical protein
MAAVFLTAGQTAFSQATCEKTTGYTNITELNFTHGFANQVKNNSVLLDPQISKTLYTYGIQTINGYKFNDHLAAGLGVGFDRTQHGVISIPVFADLRVSFGQKKVRPFFDQNAGYNFDRISAENKDFYTSPGSYFLGSSFGYAFPCSFAKSINLSLGYRGFYRKTDVHFFRDKGNVEIYSHYLTLKAGCTF